MMPFIQAFRSREKGGFNGVGIDITEKCNRRCPTCYAVKSPREMDANLFRLIVDEAHRLGFRELYLLGGEPTLHSSVLEFLRYAHKKFNPVILVTNMDRLSDEHFCRQVYNSGAVIAGQRHAVKPSKVSEEIENLLAGGCHYGTSMAAWLNVEKIFPAGRVCVQCCITRPALESGSIFDVFRWTRQMGYDPVMEFTKEGEGFKRGCKLDVDPEEIINLFREFQRIDAEEFGLAPPSNLLPQAYGKTCHLIEDSLHFLVDGTAVPCVGHHNIHYANIRDGIDAVLSHPLRQIISNPYQWIYGYCRNECEFFVECTGGCRGSAFDMTGCPRSSFYYCPHIPRSRLSLRDMSPPSCKGCILENNPACGL
jgi:radical SAM protein with 4Fe4S-binding SPASM domain